MAGQLETLTRRLELKEVRRGKENLPGVVGFRGQLLVDCNLANGKVALQIVALRKASAELALESGAPTEESLTLEEPALHGKLRVYGANPARALRIVCRPAVRDALVALLSENARLSYTDTGLSVEASAVDAEAALPIATKALRLMEALGEGTREEVLRAETERVAAKQLPLPEGAERRFVALRDVELDERKLETLRREARARVFWGKSTEETREALLSAGASEALADELVAEFRAERERDRRATLKKRLVVSAALLVFGFGAFALIGRGHRGLWALVQFFVSIACIYAGLTRLGRAVYEFTREGMN
jgi:hypothetical protein